MSRVEFQPMSRAQANDAYRVVKVSEIPHLVRIEDEGTWELCYAIVFPPESNQSSIAYAMKRDDLLKLARALQSSLAPTPEDRLLEALQRIEDRLRAPKPD